MDKFYYNLKSNKIAIRSKLPKIDILDDFYLAKKNNITNENFTKIGNLVDRKQMVYRNLINNVNSTDKVYGIGSRRPDNSNSSNYIFERQLQESRADLYNIREFLKDRVYYKFNNFFFTNINLRKKIQLKEYRIVDLIDMYSIYNKYTKNTSPLQYYSNKPKSIKSFKQQDLNLEYVLKY